MAWTQPRTWRAGEMVRTVQMNTQVRDNLLWLYNNIPSAGLSTPKYCLVERTSSQTISTSTAANITWNSQLLDNDSMWASGTDVQINTAGTYYCIFRMAWAANTTGIRYTGMYINGTLKVYQSVPEPTDSASGISRSICHLGPVVLTATDYIRTYVYQNSGGNLGTRTTAGQVPQLLVVQVA